MNDEQPREAQPEDKPPVRLVHSLGFGAGTFLAAGMVDLLAHLGPTGLVVGGIAAYVASRHGPQLYEQVREVLPSPPAREASRPPRYVRGARGERASKRSVLDRALGRFPDEDEEDVSCEQEDDTVIVDEDEPEPETWQRWRPASQAKNMLDLAPNLQIDMRDLAGKA